MENTLRFMKDTSILRSYYKVHTVFEFPWFLCLCYSRAPSRKLLFNNRKYNDKNF